MTVETGIINLLLAASGVAALVSDRVRYVELGQRETLPAIAVTRISGGPEYAQDGDIGLQRVRIQVDCYAERPTEAKNVGAAVVAALSGVVDTDSAGVTFKLIELTCRNTS